MKNNVDERTMYLHVPCHKTNNDKCGLLCYKCALCITYIYVSHIDKFQIITQKRPHNMKTGIAFNKITMNSQMPCYKTNLDECELFYYIYILFGCI